MEQKGSTGIILIVIAIFVVGGLGYAAFSKRAAEVLPPTDDEIVNSIDAGADNGFIASTPSLSDSEIIASIEGSPDAILLELERTGGLCSYGVCSSKLTFNTNSLYAYRNGDGTAIAGAVSGSDFLKLHQLISEANFAAIKSKTFTNICPSASDGQELVYTFYPSKEVIATCTYAVDADSPLFSFINGLEEGILSGL